MRKDKHGFDWTLSQTIDFLSREATDLSVHGFGNPQASESVLGFAIDYLTEYQEKQDAMSVADMGLAEVGRILRSQRERIVTLENEVESEREWSAKFEREADRYKEELRRLGAL